MSRTGLGIACALLTLCGIMLNDRLLAQQQESDPFGSKPARQILAFVDAPESAEARIESVLDEQLKSPLEFVETSLLDIVAQLSEEYGIPILFDSVSLNELAISHETEVTINLSGVSLRSALAMILRQPNLENLTTLVENEVLLITTKDRANETLLTKVYRVDDFEHFAEVPSESSSKSDCFSPLTSVIVRCVAYDSWKANGTGEGAIQLMQPGMLVVSQTRSVHQEIKALLESLRIVKAEIENGNSASGEYGRF
ncbi:MAG: hypothetical protein KDA57_10830 [Planctomycetales bacterium]|nr:hypothetical protein [Planctomycetales bacterium]